MSIGRLKKSLGLQGIEKSRSGILGLDEISRGGLPKGRATILCGGAGCGKTMVGLEFIVRGATQFDEPGVVIAFEETPEEMTKNVASLGFDLNQLVQTKKLFMDHIYIEPAEIEETGEYDLEGLFIRLDHAIKCVGAKRVMLDTLEALFSGFKNAGILRAEIRRLFRWLKERGLTTVVTAERGEGALTRHGLEEYVSDCVILLDHRIAEEISTRRMRIVKYRGAAHVADEVPFLIDENGLSVLPISSTELQHKVSPERVSTGIPDLDDMLEGKGYYRGCTALVSGTAGSGKTTLATKFAEASCLRGEKCLYVGFEESAEQVARNVSSVGVDLKACAGKGFLIHQAWRPTQYGAEMHLLRIHQLIENFQPASVVIDPVSSLVAGSSHQQVSSLLVRLIDFLKMRAITAVFTSLTGAGMAMEATDVGVSSLIDTWIVLRDIESNGERNRGIYVLKSRGMAHSNQLREFVLSSDGVRLVRTYVGAGGVLTGSSRIAQEAVETAASLAREQEIESRQRDLLRKREALEAKIQSLRAEFAAEEEEMQKLIDHGRAREDSSLVDRAQMARSRKAEANHEERKAEAAKGTR